MYFQKAMPLCYKNNKSHHGAGLTLYRGVSSLYLFDIESDGLPLASITLTVFVLPDRKHRFVRTQAYGVTASGRDRSRGRNFRHARCRRSHTSSPRCSLLSPYLAAYPTSRCEHLCISAPWRYSRHCLPPVHTKYLPGRSRIRPAWHEAHESDAPFPVPENNRSWLLRC